MDNIEKKNGDDMGMQTRVWGPAGWIFLHSIAQNYPWNPSTTQKKSYYTFFKETGHVLPCRYCRESYQKYINEKSTKLDYSILSSRKSLIQWLYLVHNKINKKLGVKEIPRLKEVFDRYESYRSKCTKTLEPKAPKGCLDPLNGYRKKCFIQIENVDSSGKVINKFGQRKTIKLVSVKKSSNQGKKFTAVFLVNGKQKITHFGFRGMSDFTKHKDPSRRSRYLLRHKRDLNTKNPTKAGFLSMFILWNKRGLKASITDYRRRLNIYNRTGKFPVKISNK